MNIRSNRIMEEQKKELNLIEILGNCPNGTELWSPAYGYMYVDSISSDKEDCWPIVCIRGDREETVFFDIRGKLLASEDAECMLFPSKDNRDWSTFKAPKPKWNPDTLQPFDKVLVRDGCNEPWKCDFFVSLDWPEGESYPYMAVTGYYKMIVPYNEETKHLIATKNEAPEYYRL